MLRKPKHSVIEIVAPKEEEEEEEEDSFGHHLETLDIFR